MKEESETLNRIVDSLDIETFIACQSEEEGKRIGLAIMEKLGFRDKDIVFIEFLGSGVRIRIRANIYKPGDAYGWLNLYK
ncbi:MAG: hypothetical protein PHI72_10360 [Atribacterota bacterium]|jgi:hypothetical protein|nr:hypothetical protein [Atribacterota bacterium]MDD4896421.1 hypothetical protein [Atribacterota bacterium]MDD5637561.1 hypothetical protein [Atribacterota bacterium]